MPEPPQVNEGPQSSGGASKSARLVLEDGAVFVGEGFGAVGRGLATAGEVVFNTAMSGYQESLTDPSYTAQILVETAPMIGNTGVNDEDLESGGVAISGLVVRELARRHSSYRATGSLSGFLAEAGVLGITGVDTRALTKRLRTAGALRGIISDRQDLTDAELVEMAREAPSMDGANLVDRVGRDSSETWPEDLGDWTTQQEPGASATGHPTELKVLALDCGAKHNILRNLTDRGCTVTVIPHTTPAGEIIATFESGDAHGLFVSNGPGDPAAVEATIESLRAIIAHDPPIPVFGICLGHQLLSLAVGAKTYKLKFGHRGANQPVKNTISGKVEITSQNHGFAVDADSLEAVGAEVTHVNLNDDTVAGFRLKGRPVFAVQHHPEASPGPHDAGYLFDQFVQALGTRARSVSDGSSSSYSGSTITERSGSVVTSSVGAPSW